VRRILFALCMLAFVSCASAPPSLSPAATTAFKKTQVIKAIDLLRDVAIDANAQTPPLVSTATTRKIVEAHRTALLTIRASDSGWAAAVGATLDTLSHDPSFLPEEVSRFAPYFSLIAAVITQVSA